MIENLLIGNECTGVYIATMFMCMCKRYGLYEVGCTCSYSATDGRQTDFLVMVAIRPSFFALLCTPSNQDCTRS